ncbi:exopolysaccharide biosynthesis polyprenyl glycosylphosphotransferase [Cloacibacterium sp. TD35]|uniref:exopolysaccharide biosynthesis polyprenyl glycosylphosphotransferase n=1 Tax=Cloacibacterium sp. TD35 TaxID=2976818 RepID=UPI00237E1C60|nr:exopolysaccharide biosynthesis polyprenyl glycosylphosphotransferase [Cloacibacterium sp. TD35]WDT68450.1 exopolysaccharide biosynthesis polyprenyl glycosylphosphotransferase [Cloacibacterium sp. TD35]
MQKLRYSRYFKSAIIILDIFIVAAVFVFFFLMRHKYVLEKVRKEENFLSLVLLSLFWILLSGRTKLYSIPRNLTYTLYLERIITHIFIFLLGILLLAKVSNNEFLKDERFLITFTLFITFFIVKSFIFFSLKYIRLQGKNYRNVMFIAENSSSDILKDIITHRKDYGYRVYEFLNDDITITKLQNFWREKEIHTIFIPYENNLNQNLLEEINREAENDKIKISLIPSAIHNEFFQYDLGYIETQTILTPSKFPLDYYSNAIIKRIFDFTFSLLVLIFIASWLFPIIALLIKLDSKGSVFFVQKRYGFHDEVFECIKFRTMVENNESTTKTTSQNDSRITKIGRFLRKTSLDEMPQFINVLKGDMSVVGPRPHMLLIDEFYKAKIGRYSVRSLVQPGITGLAQVSGLRGDTGDMEIEMKKRVIADSFYVKNWSLTLDIVIILKTILLVIKGDQKAI